ncbi:hypothetical protein M5362_25295 [Streptomyces sp. Je 1-79]|uniref:hypothetical protein n=1 Tax=Streptomyces sp. Je 1-79 TaxID=2943847 RepID=UPI0021A7C8C9|nr:hypothetical protein [Streptomyces sp. Je 1-79]MCT4356449.1 hypothetical protein [Streptomyces sp. Je 1-79]
MPWDEWEQLKADAGSQSSARMQLNEVPSDRTGGSGAGEAGDLKADQQDLAAVGDSAFKLFNDLGREGRNAWSSSQNAAKDLTTQEFELGAALHTVQDRWEKSLTSLLDACAHISNHMDFTKKVHAGDDQYIASTVSSIATLDKGFDEGTNR